jgi:putative ABC transport system substrate-binding protein
MKNQIRRRDFITLLGGVASAPALIAPHAAHAQQRPLPVIGFLNAGSLEMNVARVRAFYEGLKEAGYVEGDNVTILYRWAENRITRLPEAADLVRRRVAVLATYLPQP